jgi:hypothetical protein
MAGGGKVSPRQKMINLMYLVFIAMIAMNVSKDVLSAFGNFDKRQMRNPRSLLLLPTRQSKSVRCPMIFITSWNL